MTDRSKYEKLTLNTDDQSSDDSSIMPDSKVEAGLGKSRHRLKKNVVSNIPEKLQSVYNKVDKSTIPVVRRLADKKNNSKNLANKSTKAESPVSRNDGVDIDSDDSIGSASDLTAVEQGIKKTVVGFFVKNEDGDETISQSNKTCGSSAYHAECESVTTNEDDGMSRSVVRKCKTRRQRQLIDNTTNKLILEESSNHFTGYECGNEPLLLDESDDEREEHHKKSDLWSDVKFSLNDSDVAEEAGDVFALAPFAKPEKLKPITHTSIPNINENPFSNENKDLSILEPQKQEISTDLFIPTNKYPENLTYNEVSVECNAMKVESDDSLYDAFLPTSTDKSSVNFNKYNTSLEKIQCEIEHNSQDAFVQIESSSHNCDLFGSQPFCEGLNSDYSNSQTIANLSETHPNIQNEINHINMNANKVTSTENAHLFCDELDDHKESFFDNRIYENVIFPSTVNRYSDMSFQIHNMPIRLKLGHSKLTNSDVHDSSKSRRKDFLSSDPSQIVKSEDNSAETAEKVSKQKKDKKIKSKYQHLLDKKSNKEDLPFHTKFEQKLTKGALGYKKVSSKNKKSNDKSSSQTGFSNMSFEDIPQDPDMDF